MTINRRYEQFVSSGERGTRLWNVALGDGHNRDTLLRGPKAAVQRTESSRTATLGQILRLLAAVYLQDLAHEPGGSRRGDVRREHPALPDCRLK